MYRPALLIAAAAGAVSAYTSNNSPMAPGNENLPTGAGGFQLETEKGLPVVNIKYRFNSHSQDAGSVLAQSEADVAFNRRLQDAYSELAEDSFALANAYKSSFVLRSAQDEILNAQASYPVNAVSVTDDISEIVKGIGAPPPRNAVSSLYDPASTEVESSCDRDYTAKCPLGFASSGTSCAPTTYQGPCSGESYDFSSWPVKSKVRFSSQCGAFFPCRTCTRDYSKTCPNGFQSTGGSKCGSTATYTGPCTGEADFSSFNSAMLAQWSQNCGAYWPCA
jgi:CPW-WPC domain-containing protein